MKKPTLEELRTAVTVAANEASAAHDEYEDSDVVANAAKGHAEYVAAEAVKARAHADDARYKARSAYNDYSDALSKINNIKDIPK